MTGTNPLRRAVEDERGQVGIGSNPTEPQQIVVLAHLAMVLTRLFRSQNGTFQLHDGFLKLKYNYSLVVVTYDI